MSTALITHTRNSGPLDGFFDQVAQSAMNHRASHVVRELSLVGYDDLQRSIGRAMKACAGTGIPVHRNFKRIFVGAEHDVHCDWLLSDLGYALLSNVVRDPQARNGEQAQ